LAASLIACPDCDGTGSLVEDDCSYDDGDVCDSTCPTCEGTGHLPAVQFFSGVPRTPPQTMSWPGWGMDGEGPAPIPLPHPRARVGDLVCRCEAGCPVLPQRPGVTSRAPRPRWGESHVWRIVGDCLGIVGDRVDW
jgi:hypothetical protein